MFKIIPDKSKDFPLRILAYWLISWGSFFLLTTVQMIPRISSSGYVVRKDVCLETSSDGRYDEGEKCTVYGEPRYLPVGTEIINNFRHYGLNTALIIFPFGFFLMWGKRTEEKKKIS